MFTCIVCRFTHHLDDVAVPLADDGRCICVGCFAREAGDPKRMPKSLRAQVIAALNELDVAV